MKSINVVAAIIKRGDAILATQRGYGDWEGWWEFPGGKVEAGEAPEQALVREIHEELNARIVVGDYLCTAEYDYPDFHLSMRCYMRSLVGEGFELLEHHAALWLDVEHLEEVRWLPADLQVIEKIREAV